MEKLFARILFIPVTAYFLYQVISIFRNGLFNFIFYYSNERSDAYDQLKPFFPIFTLLFIVWIILHFALEILAYLKGGNKFSYWLKNLRYAPIAALILSGFITIFFDFGMIEYSKWRIRNYIFSSSQSIEEPDFRLHSDYRHWCGNGAMANVRYLYFSTASSGVDAENPKVRVRSLLMTYDIWGFFNGNQSPELDKILKKSCIDSDSDVRNIAGKFLSWRKSNCREFLSAK